MTRDGYVPPVFRDFSDLTRQELTDRVRYLEILRVKVAYTRERFSPRQVRASGLAIVMSVVIWVFTASVTCSVVSGLFTLAWILRYSRLPRTWHAQLQEGISRLESLRSSPLRHMYVEQDAGTDWHYASCCLDAEIERIHFALSGPARPFSA